MTLLGTGAAALRNTIIEHGKKGDRKP